ncbi:hypothetical protein PIB30_032205 [Stylosanthes scabra]|uniref:Uncharacterized protein n=1 Tax=Stylosanthes scabra TaxID=79078 RepID=A0ABU6SCA9_9FABA|nr:hypothetical protein [Stylosanthes scabra]
MARPPPLGGVAARSEIAKIHNLKPPRVRAMPLARPRGEHNDIWPKQHKYVARSRPSLGARARPCVRTTAVARPRPRALSSRTNYCKVRAPAPAPRMDRKRESEDAKEKGKLAMPPTRKSSRLAGLPLFVPITTSPRSVLRPNKLLVQAIATIKGELSPKASAQATRIIARGGPSRPKPKKAVIIDLVSDEEGEVQGKETTAEEPPLVATRAEEKEEEEDPEEYIPPYSPLPPFPPSPERWGQESMTTHTIGTMMGTLTSGALM